MIMWSQNKNLCGLHSAPRSNKHGVGGDFHKTGVTWAVTVRKPWRYVREAKLEINHCRHSFPFFDPTKRLD